jgi:hypothetical protein
MIQDYFEGKNWGKFEGEGGINGKELGDYFNYGFCAESFYLYVQSI